MALVSEPIRLDDLTEGHTVIRVISPDAVEHWTVFHTYPGGLKPEEDNP
jgi:hypothetical protein